MIPLKEVAREKGAPLHTADVKQLDLKVDFQQEAEPARCRLSDGSSSASSAEDEHGAVALKQIDERRLEDGGSVGMGGVCHRTPNAMAWRKTLADEFGQKAYPIADTAVRGITIRQLRQVFNFARTHCGKWNAAARCHPKEEQVDPKDNNPARPSNQRLHLGILTLYHMNDWVIKPLTQNVACDDAASCSFVELVARSEQPPVWYVSHWWGEIVRDFMRCVDLHAKLRKLGPDVALWVCAYANRQHMLSMELVENPEDTSFFRAMVIARGVLLIVDEVGPGEVFRRLWCQFEQAMAFRRSDQKEYLFDIATTKGGTPHLLADGVAEADKYLEAKDRRESRFPIRIIEAGLDAKLREAKATEAADRRNILNYLAKRELKLEPEPEHEAYAEVDRRLHALFAVAAWPQAAKQNLVSKLRLPKALAGDVQRKVLRLDLNDCEGGDLAAELGEALAGLRSLQDLQLYFNRCVGLANITELGKSLLGLQDLQHLELEFSECTALAQIAELARGLGRLQKLRYLELNFSKCSALAEISGLGCSLVDLPDLQHFELSLNGCSALTPNDLDTFVPCLAYMGGLEELVLNFGDCANRKDVAQLGRGLSCLQNLRHLHLDLSNCPSVVDATPLCEGITKLHELRKLHLDFRACTQLAIIPDFIYQREGLPHLQHPHPIVDIERCSALQCGDCPMLDTAISSIPRTAGFEDAVKNVNTVITPSRSSPKKISPQKTGIVNSPYRASPKKSGVVNSPYRNSPQKGASPAAKSKPRMARKHTRDIDDDDSSRERLLRSEQECAELPMSLPTGWDVVVSSEKEASRFWMSPLQGSTPLEAAPVTPNMNPPRAPATPLALAASGRTSPFSCAVVSQRQRPRLVRSATTDFSPADDASCSPKKRPGRPRLLGAARDILDDDDSSESPKKRRPQVNDKRTIKTARVAASRSPLAAHAPSDDFNVAAFLSNKDQVDANLLSKLRSPPAPELPSCVRVASAA